MKKLIIIFLLLASINGNSQIQRYYSYTQYRIETGGYGDMFNDTCKILIQDNSALKLLVISGKTLIEFIPIYDIRHEYMNTMGVKSIVYRLSEGAFSIIIEFLYNNEKLQQITIIRPNSISNYIIEPLNNWL